MVDFSCFFLIILPTCAEMYRTAFWMHHFGHPNDKRTKLWAPSYYISLFNRGPIKKNKNGKRGPATAVKYVDGRGILRYKGTPDLKRSQSLPLQLIVVECLGIHEGMWYRVPFLICKEGKKVKGV